MPEQLSFDTARSAVLSMDYQAGIVSIYAKDQEDLLTRAASELAAWPCASYTFRWGFVPAFQRLARAILYSAPSRDPLNTRGSSKARLVLFIPELLHRGTILSSPNTASAPSQARIWT